MPTNGVGDQIGVVMVAHRPVKDGRTSYLAADPSGTRLGVDHCGHGSSVPICVNDTRRCRWLASRVRITYALYHRMRRQ
jgi:hypothetical protein